MAHAGSCFRTEAWFGKVGAGGNDDDTAAMPATQSKKLQPIKVTNKHVYVRRV